MRKNNAKELEGESDEDSEGESLELDNVITEGIETKDTNDAVETMEVDKPKDTEKDKNKYQLQPSQS